jgi:predicted RNase H-like HicB family nuclease
MAAIHYPAIIERAEEGYSVFFPDLPGCTSAGTTMQEAALNAEEALSGHLIVSAQHGDDIPAPSSMESIGHDADVEEVARILVRAERPGRAKRINIMMDESLIEAIDRLAPNRSAFLADAARMALAARREVASGGA